MVEHDLAKVGVEGSSPFARSNFSPFHPEGPGQRGDLGLGIEMRRLPTELSPGFRAAQPQADCVALRPFAKLGRDLICGDNPRRLIRQTEASCARARAIRPTSTPSIATLM